MSETAETHPLVQRLAVDRVAAPGILDRRALQRAHDRFSQPAGAHVLSRLQRRLAPASPAAESLPLVRADRSAEQETATPAKSVAVATAPVSAPDTVGPRGSVGGASPIVAKLVSRETPSVAPVSAFVMRRIDSTPGLIARARSELSISSPISRPANGPRADANGVVQRVTESRDATHAAPVVERASVTAPNDRHPERSEGPAVRLQIPRVARDDGPSAPAMTTTSPLPRVSASNAATASAPFLWRKAHAPAAPAISGALPVITRSPAAVVAAPQLVLRMLDAAVVPAQLPAHAASIASVTNDIATTDVAAPESAATESTSDERVRIAGSDLDMDWIAEQVGSRLARRLEIERERHGVRQWRQVS